MLGGGGDGAGSEGGGGGPPKADCGGGGGKSAGKGGGGRPEGGGGGAELRLKLEDTEEVVVSRLVKPARANVGFLTTRTEPAPSEGGGGGGSDDGSGGGAGDEFAGGTGAVAEAHPPFENPGLLAGTVSTGAHPEIPLDLTTAGSEDVEDDATVAHPDFLKPPEPPEEDSSAGLNALPQPPLAPSDTGVITGARPTAPTATVGGAGASLTPEAAASRFSSFSSRFRSFSRALELSFGRCAASISLKRCD